MIRKDAKKFKGIPLSVLDLAPISEGSTVGESIRNSVNLAQNVEKWGFNRYWLAEHHNMPGIASSATSVLIGHIAGATSELRVGAGGIMLPNHAPLVIAEQFGTLESIYPGRIDLGLGRAPGSDQATAHALRRTLHSTGDDFPEQLHELRSYFDPDPTDRVKAYPGEGLDIPIWLLGSSGFSARLASMEGLPFSFASHFAPGYLMQALELYRKNFQPSESLQQPHVMLGINIILADTEEHAKFVATSQQQQFLSLTRGMPTRVQPPVKDMEEVWTPYEKMSILQTLHPQTTFVGTVDTVRPKIEEFIELTGADELIVNTLTYAHEDRIRSYELLAQVMD